MPALSSMRLPVGMTVSVTDAEFLVAVVLTQSLEDVVPLANPLPNTHTPLTILNIARGTKSMPTETLIKLAVSPTSDGSAMTHYQPPMTWSNAPNRMNRRPPSTKAWPFRLTSCSRVKPWRAIPLSWLFAQIPEIKGDPSHAADLAMTHAQTATSPTPP